jgi:hypothetical protein
LLAAGANARVSVAPFVQTAALGWPELQTTEDTYGGKELLSLLFPL